MHATCPEGDGPVDVEAQQAAAAEAAHLDDAPVIGAGAGDQQATSTPQEPQSGAQAPRPALAPPSAVSGRAKGPRREELKPWEAHNPDGSVNLGSYAFTAAVGMVELAGELVVNRARVDNATRGVPLEAPSAGKVKFLAGWLLSAADHVQADLRRDGRVDRMDNSHTRARGAIRSALDLYPVPWGATPEQRQAWHDALVAYGILLLRVALDVIEPVA